MSAAKASAKRRRVTKKTATAEKSMAYAVEQEIAPILAAVVSATKVIAALRQRGEVHVFHPAGHEVRYFTMTATLIYSMTDFQSLSARDDYRRRSVDALLVVNGLPSRSAVTS